MGLRRAWVLPFVLLAATTVLQACGGSGKQGAQPFGLGPDGAAGNLVDAELGNAGAGGTPVDAQGGSLLGGGLAGAGGSPVDGGNPLGGAGGAGLDGGSTSGCGGPGLPCCAGNACNDNGCCVSGICMQPGGTCVGLGGGVCNAGVCGSCGGAGLPCCGANPASGSCTAPGTSCSNGICTKCGEVGLACCPGASPGSGTCSAANTICSANLCVACGVAGGACCPGNKCASGCCYASTCLAENATCGTNAGKCQAGQCSACGHSGQACCPSSTCYEGLACNNGTCSSCGHTGESCCPAGGATATCQAGTICSGNTPDSVCARCGGLGDFCCPGNVCANGCCSGGRCLASSGSCSAIPTNCGNGVLNPGETCDDNNTLNNDGCSADCTTVEPGWQCRVPGKTCTPLCGDSVLKGSEKCDDGNANSGDGCSSTCQVEPGATCLVPGKACSISACGNGVLEPGELCDCGSDPNKLPLGCKSINGLFYGDGMGCSKTCTKEPNCRDSAGHNQACETTCGDGNLDTDEECDDGNLSNGDGCSSTCQQETGFSCSTKILQDASPCKTGTGECLELPIIYRDFQPENVPGGHPDFWWLGTQSNGQVTDWCVPNSSGPSKGNDSRARYWDLVAADLVNGKPVYNSARADNLADCTYTDWSRLNASRIKGGYALAESPLYDPSTGSYRSDVTYNSYDVATWSGKMPMVKSAATFNQWFNDDPSVNQTYNSTIELGAIGTSLYRFASKSHLMDGGFFPLDSLNPAQKTLCNMWPYWHAWTTCSGDQYLMPPRVVQGDCPSTSVLSSGCWVTNMTGQKHDSYFTEEVRYYFVYDSTVGLTLQFYGDDDLFIFINGKLVLDLGGTHQQLPGKVTVAGSPGDASVVEGGCLDSAGNIAGVIAGSKECSPTNSTPVPPPAKSPDDFRTRNVALGLVHGKTYEIAIFGADRHPPESNFQLSLTGYTTKRSVCVPGCGDGVVSVGEECDCGDGKLPTPAGCPGPNNDTTYGGCTLKCKLGPYCGDGVKNGSEACDLGKSNGDTSLGKDGCTLGCTKPPFCGDGQVDASLGEQCDLGANNGQPASTCSAICRLMP